MNERLPPLQGLYYFYIAAELGSFKRASESLFVTAAAISQQIRQLEESVGTQLFHRSHRKIQLTREGKLLFDEAKQGFKHLQQGVRLINQDPEPNRLSISTPPSFAQHWLIPRIQNFREQYEALSILVEPTNKLVLFQDSLVDICIRYGEGNYDNIESRFLMDEIIYPVCHPLYQEKHGIYDINDLSRADLIEDTWPDMDWSTWLKNVDCQASRPTIQYNGSHFVVEGALAVQGVALVKHSLAARYIEEGKLIRIGQVGLRPRYRYYVCAPAGYFQREKITSFCRWLQSEVDNFHNRPIKNLKILDTNFSLK
ncbi:LysR substrate-binding domain-containing protein [Vibrio nomapromontoriensis]|uniref:LysR substrate-binding domain-containing protein n=1 Tax=Vibrio nomapromontoriensis TaxID=2910246 RepID=UPI003D0FC3BC